MATIRDGRNEEELITEIHGLDEENARLREMLDCVSDAAFFKDSAGRYLAVNRAFARFAGVGEMEAVGKTDDELFGADRAARYRLNDIEVMRTRQRAVFYSEERAVDGALLRFETVKSPLIDSRGRLLGVAGVSRDLSGSAADKAAADGGLRFVMETFARLGDAVFVFDGQSGRVVDVNDEASRLTGLCRNELAALHAWDLFPWTGGARRWGEAVAAMRPSGRQAAVVELQGKDGAAKPVEASCGIYGSGGAERAVFCCRDISEKRGVAAELDTMKRLYGAVADGVPLCVVLLDEEGRVLTWNRAVEEYTGVARSDVLGRRLFEALPELKSAGWGEKIADVIKKREPLGLTGHKYVRTLGPRSGEVCCHNTWLTPVEGSDGAPLCLVLYEDVTERMLAAERYKTIIHSAREGFAMVSMDGRFLDVNDSYLRMVGYTREEILSKRLFDLEFGESYEETVRHTNMIMKSGYDLFEVRHKCKDGAVIDLEISAHYVELGKGVIFSFLRDISAIKRAERMKLNEERRFTEELVETLPGLFFMLDQGGRFVRWNRNFEDFTGRSEREIRGMRWRDVVAPEEGESAFLVMAEGFSAGHVQTEFPLAARDGSRRIFYCSARATELYGARHLVGAAVDITEMKRLESELLKTQKLDSVGALAGGIAHDFNNILTGILGGISLLKMKYGEDEKAVKILDMAESASLRAQALANKLLTFSKGGAPVKRRLDVALTVRSAAEFALSGASSRCEFMVDPDLLSVEADEMQLVQAVGNIIVNADQSMPDGGVIVVRCENALVSSMDKFGLPKGRYVCITVADTGVGIPAEHLQRLFDPFFTTKEKRSGLGLASAYSIVKRHGGAITVASEPDKGSEFKVYLPAAP